MAATAISTSSLAGLQALGDARDGVTVRADLDLQWVLHW